MSRQLLCMACGQRRLPDGTRKILERSDEGEPAEFQRLVVGWAKKPNPFTHGITVNDMVFPLDPNYFLCDDCNAEIKPGERCAAWSVWTEVTGPEPEWETDFLEMRQ